MSSAKVVEVFAESPDGFEAAICRGIEQASTTVENIKAAWVSEQKLKIEDGQITGYIVGIRVTIVRK